MMVLAIARFTFREAVRKKVLLGAVVLSVGFLVLFALGDQFAYQDFTSHPTPTSVTYRPIVGNAMGLAGLYVVNFLAGLLAIFTAVGTISSEVDSGTLHAILPKPISRWEVVLGKWLGFAVMLCIYLSAMAVGVMLSVYATWNVVPPQPAAGIALMCLSTLLLLSLTVLGSTIMPTVANGIVIFLLYGVGLMGGFVEQIGSLVENQTMVNIGIITSLVIPSDVLWKMASSVLQPTEMLARSVMTPFFGGSPPSTAMIVYALVYTAAAVVAATVLFRRRDL